MLVSQSGICLLAGICATLIALALAYYLYW